MANTPTVNPPVDSAPKKGTGPKIQPTTESEVTPHLPAPAASRQAEPLRGTVIDEVTELPMGGVPLLWTVTLGGASHRRPGKTVEIGHGFSHADGTFTITPGDSGEVQEALCQFDCVRGVKAWVEVDPQGAGISRKVEVRRANRETLLRVSGNGQELTTEDWCEVADFLQGSRLLTVGDLVHELASPGVAGPQTEWRTAKRARALGHIAAAAEQAGHHLPGLALLDQDHQANLDALAEGEIDKAVNQFRNLVDFKRFGGIETDWHIGLFPSRKSDTELYRDYLRSTWVAAAQKMYSASNGPAKVAAAALERQIAGRFHQDFRTSDSADVPAAKLLIPILREALLADENRDGFGLPPAAIPPQGAQSDDDYLAVLIGLTGKTLTELRNRFRVRFDRTPGERTDAIALNIEALLGLLSDTWQSPEEPFPAIPTLWSVQEQGKPLIFAPFIGRAPFYLQFEEWRQQTLRFYPENVYNVRRNIPRFDQAFRDAIAGMKTVSLRWNLAYNAVAYNGDAYFKSQGDWTSSAEWIEKLFPIADTLREAMRIADGLDYKQAHDKLNWCAEALKAALKDYKPHWTKDKFYWSYSNDVWADRSPLISLKSRSTRSVKNPGELGAFETWFEGQYILPWKGVVNDMESEIRDMQFTHARSLLIYDMLYIYHVLLPYLRAGLCMVTGDYATAAKLLGRITGYEVGIGETASPAGYLVEPKWGRPAMIDGITLPYSTAVGVDGTYYADLKPTFDEPSYKDRIVLAPFELRFFQLAQGEVMLLLADELYRNDDPSSIRRARELFKGIIFLHGEDPDIDPHFVLQYLPLPPLGKIDTGNPARAAQLARARLGFYQIEQGLNVYGFRSDMVPVLRYRPLKQAADLFATGAKSAQTDFLSYMMKFEQAQIEAWQTNALLKKAEASKVIAGEHIEIAKVGVAKAQEQVAQVKAQITAKQQEIADANSFFSQFKTFFGGMKDAVTGMVPLADKVMNDDAPASSVSGDQLKLILTKSLSSTAAGKEAAVAALGSGAAMTIGFGAFAYAGYTSMSSMADTMAKRDGDLKSLQTVALPAAEAQVKLKQRDVTIAQQELAIAQADVDLAQALRRFQQDRFLNVDLWNKLASFANQLIRRYLDLAARTGWLAERALAYEQNREISIIRMNYYPKAMRGLTGADRLQLDLAELEANRLQGVRLTVPIKHTVSLAREYPLAFGQLKDKGRCRIRTQEAPLRAAYPGSFGYRIRAVTVAAQDSGGAPPRGMFRNLGVSEVSRDDSLKPNLLLRFPDALPLSEFRLQDDLFVYGLPGETLLQFEGSGFDTAWEVELPIAANPRGLRSLSDIVITFDMNASYSQALATRLALEPPTPVARAILLAASVQDSRGLSNLRAGAAPARIRFDPNAIALPAQEKNRKLANLALLAIGKTEKTYNATITAVQAAVQASFQVKDGMAMSNAGDLLAGGTPSPLNGLVGLSLDQAFEIEIDRTGVQDELQTLFDIVLYLDYVADL